MARVVFRINHAGVAEFLRSDGGVRGLIEAGTSAAAAQVRNEISDQRVDPKYVLDGVLITDRPQGNITIAVRRAEALNAKYGYLDRAAFAAGFREINQK